MFTQAVKAECTDPHSIEQRPLKKRFSGPQIVGKLRQADFLIGQGKKIPEVCKEIVISENTYYRWRQKYGGIPKPKHLSGICFSDDLMSILYEVTASHPPVFDLLHYVEQDLHSYILCLSDQGKSAPTISV